MEMAPGIHRIGNEGMVNSYLVEDSGEVTIVDAGIAGLYRELPGELHSMGRSVEDVRALVLTHGHSDHIGYAERLRTERGVPVSVHEADAALARGEVPNPARGVKGTGRTKLVPFAGFIWYSLLRGGLRTTHLGAVSTFGDGATLDVPGAPRVVLTPGHTPGSAVLHLASKDALLVGDAFATYAVTTGKRGPRLAPFTADAPQAVESLARIEHLDASILLPGHGAPFHGSAAEAARLVRESA